MKIARLLKDGKETYGIIKNDKVATRQIITYETGVPLPLSIRDFLFDGWYNEIENKISDSSFQDNLKNFQLVEPLPNPSKIICLTFNYPNHAKENNVMSPKDPVIFFKPRTSLCGTGSDIICPSFVKQLDYEIELAVIIGEKIKKLSITITKEDVLDVTEIFKDCESKIIQKALQSKAKIKAIRIRNFSGMFGFEPYSGIRLGKEIGQLVRFFGIGGVFHSDELPNYGINDSDVDKIRKHLELTNQDGFLIIAGEDPKLDYAIDSIIKRIQDAANGVPAETRAATQDGETIFLRPRPGASRMYPETDIPSISVSPEEVKFARENIPKSWDESIAEIQQKYDLNSQLSEQIFDSEYRELFEKICENKKNSPNFVASILCSSITNLERKGFDGTLLKPEHVIESFELLASGKIPKESLEIIFESIMSGKSENVAIAMQSTDVSSMDEGELNGIIDKIIQNNMDLVKERGEHAVVTLMGITMKEVRGKASGKMVNDLLRKKVSEL